MIPPTTYVTKKNKPARLSDCAAKYSSSEYTSTASAGFVAGAASKRGNSAADSSRTVTLLSSARWLGAAVDLQLLEERRVVHGAAVSRAAALG
jgi:hypothetical protein